MNKTNGLVIGLVVVIIILVGYIVFKPGSKSNFGETHSSQQTENPIDSKTGLTYPNGFLVSTTDQNLIVKFTRGSDFIEIAEKYSNDPNCEKFYQGENFGFCVKGYHGEASSDELANSFISLNK